MNRRGLPVHIHLTRGKWSMANMQHLLLLTYPTITTNAAMQLSLLCLILIGRRWGIIGDLNRAIIKFPSTGAANHDYTYVHMCSKYPPYKANTPTKGHMHACCWGQTSLVRMRLGSKPLQNPCPSTTTLEGWGITVIGVLLYSLQAAMCTKAFQETVYICTQLVIIT